MAYIVTYIVAYIVHFSRFQLCNHLALLTSFSYLTNLSFCLCDSWALGRIAPPLKALALTCTYFLTKPSLHCLQRSLFFSPRRCTLSSPTNASKNPTSCLISIATPSTFTGIHHRLTIHGAGAMGSILQLLFRLLVSLACVLSRMHAYVAAHHPTTNTISTPPQSILRRPATCRYKSIYSAWWRVLLTRHRKSKICVM